MTLTSTISFRESITANDRKAESLTAPIGINTEEEDVDMVPLTAPIGINTEEEDVDMVPLNIH